MDVAPLPARGMVAKVSWGQFPPPFVISNVRTAAKVAGKFYSE
jgi:hypothetical protein